jgi:hypothetical protein
MKVVEKKLDLNKKFVQVGPFAIQEEDFFGPFDIDEAVPPQPHRLAAKLQYVAAQCGCLFSTCYCETKVGKHEEYWHEFTCYTLTNPDGSLIYSIKWISYCEGPGFSCSYSHGPWFCYGTYHG